MRFWFSLFLPCGRNTEKRSRGGESFPEPLGMQGQAVGIVVIAGMKDPSRVGINEFVIG